MNEYDIISCEDCGIINAQAIQGVSLSHNEKENWGWDIVIEYKCMYCRYRYNRTHSFTEYDGNTDGGIGLITDRFMGYMTIMVEGPLAEEEWYKHEVMTIEEWKEKTKWKPRLEQLAIYGNAP